MKSKEANVDSASAYSGVIPHNSLHQTQYESMGSLRRTGAEEEEEEESQRNQIGSDKEPTPVKRKPKSSSLNAGDGIQASYDTVESLQKRLHGGRKTIKSKHKKPKRDKDKSEDHMYSDLRSRSSKYTQKDEDKDCVCEIRLKKRGLVGLLKKIAYKRSNQKYLRDFVIKNKIKIGIPLKEDELEKARTKQEPSDSFGLIEIRGFDETDALTRYLRCAPDTKADIIWNMMIKKWHLERPHLIISVTCDTQRFDLKRIMQEKFNLMKAATSTCTWIITGGRKSGVMELVRGAVNDHNFGRECKNDIVVLGVAPWGCVANRQALKKEELRNSNNDTNVPLDKIHSHFILIDDASKNKCGSEIDFRTSLEKFISEQSVDPNDKESSLTIPVISIIVDGGINSMKMMWQSVMNRIPVLVLQSSGMLQSSGRAADFIALGYNITTSICNEEESFFPITFDEDMKEFADRIFKWKEKDLRRKPELVDICLKQLREALQHREMLTVFDLNDNETEEFDRAILYALLKANRSNTNAQLSLALAWDRSDIAENEIFTALKKTNYQKLKLDNAMMTALIQDRLEFVKLFQKNGIGLSQFLDISNLGNLYSKCFEDKKDVSARLLLNRINKLKLKERIKVRQALCCECPKDNGGKTDLFNYIGKVIADLLDNKNINMCPVQWEGQLKNPAKHFFIWAVLMNRMSLAKLFWRIGSDHIEAALFASCLLKKLSKKAYDEYELELSLTLTQHSSEFEKLASKILGICYLQDRSLSHKLLVRELSGFGNTTLFFLAEENRLMDFLDQACCQTKLNAIWIGRMAPSTSRKKIVASILMPLFIFAITFVPEQQDDNVCKDRCVKLLRWNRKVADSQDSTSKILDEGGQDGNCCLKCLLDFHSFYTAPVTKFITAMFANIVFLGLFSFFVLTDLHPIGENGAPSLVEIFSWIYTITSLIDEIKQVATSDHSSIRYKIRSWRGSKWNVFDIVIYLSFLTSVILRFLLYGEDFICARRLYSLTLGMYFFRFLQYFDAEKNIGPKVTMIFRMFTDLMFFLLILLVFILSFGVTYQANLYPNAPQQWSVLKDVLYHPYWQMYGELFLEYMEGKDPSEEADNCTKNETLWRSGEKERCPENSFLVVLLTAVFMLLTNVLLLNLLIAMFSDTFKKVHDNSEKEWRFHRFSLVCEYDNRPFLFPPLNILVYMFWLIRLYCKRSCKCCDNKKDTSFRKKLREKDHKELSQFERGAMEEYMHSELTLENDKIDKKLQTIVKRVDRVNEKVDKTKDKVYHLWWRHQKKK